MSLKNRVYILYGEGSIYFIYISTSRDYVENITLRMTGISMSGPTNALNRLVLVELLSKTEENLFQRGCVTQSKKYLSRKSELWRINTVHPINFATTVAQGRQRVNHEGVISTENSARS